MDKVERTYSDDNWKRLYAEMYREYMERLARMNFVIQETKTQLMTSIENIKGLCDNLTHDYERQKKQEKRKLLMGFIESTRINICLTSPKTRLGLSSSLGRQK